MSLRKLGRPDEASEELNKLNQHAEEYASEFQLSANVRWSSLLYYEALRADLDER